MMQYDPYKPRFPRGQVLESLQNTSLVHPLLRDDFVPYFRRKNPKGYHHDLGAMDVFLDNFGILVREQFSNEQFVSYTEAVKSMLNVWQRLQWLVLQREPYWGEYMNSKRQANAGEPRSLLRLYGDDDWSRVPSSLWYGTHNSCLQEAKSDSNPFLRIFDGKEFLCPGDSNGLHPSPAYPFADWDPSNLVEPGYWERGNDVVSPSQERPGGFGIILPPDMSPTVDTLKLLPPQEATPDLPPRVGRRAEDLALYEQVHRDQGMLGTCAAFAVCMALDLLLAREGQRIQFSPSWLHCQTWTDGRAGRRLSDVVGYVKQQLPCEESVFPYEPDKLKDWKYSQGDWWTEAMVENSDLLSDKFDTPEILELDVRDVSRIKTLLASGWLVIAATAITDEMWQNGFHRLGYLTAPLYGQKRVDGHAWLLVGYDHIDGNQQWKYQGHFLVLNSWPDRKDTSPLGRGVCTLPFVTLLTEGIEAYAIRLRS
jgi:hypothetical protein